MKRTLLKVLLVLSIVVLILVPVFALAVWGAASVVGGIFAAMTDMSPSSFDPFSNFVGSPLFYVEVVAAISAVTSTLLLIFTRKR